MVRFKVIKGSHILMILAAIILIAAIAFVLLQTGAASTGSTAAQAPSGMRTEQLKSTEAKAQAAFASAASAAQLLQIEVIPDAPEPSAAASIGSILIYHTHTHEAYAQDEDDPYEAIETWRTVDVNHSVVRVGEALAQELRAYGFSVIHDTTDHEKDSLGEAYLRSLDTMQSYAQSFDLRIDLHRDAYVDGLKPCLRADDGAEYAQLMLLVGRGDAYSDADKPPYAENLEYAQRLTGELNALIPDICRNVTVKKGRYNQHVDRRCILVEVGHNQNTLEQALSSISCLAKAIKNMYR